jgi:2-phospho-L-lactate guanylyltransferase
VLVVPVKALGTAKSRLRGALPGVAHERLVLALACDTVAAAVRCADVLVVTADPAAGRALAGLGARVVPDPPVAGLNAALAHGAAAAGPGRRVGALTADLPALRPTDLAGALAAAGTGRAFVADAAGTGTTLLLAAPGQALSPRFGAGSAGAHAAGGARPLVAPPALRRDVDTAADLTAATRLGLGRHTDALVRRLVPGHAQPPAANASPRRLRARYGARMQGTVATYDAGTRSGTLLLDDGTEVAFPAAAFEASGLRLLRQGQRVRVEVESGEIVRVTLPTF